MRFPIASLHTLRSISLVLAFLALGGGAMAQGVDSGNNLSTQDPHGWILTLTSVSVVFLALISLVIVFALIGKLFSKASALSVSTASSDVVKGVQSPKVSSEAEVAIAMALTQWQAEREAEVVAVIGLALDAELNAVHDQESFTLTIQRRTTQWNARSLGLRQGV